MKINITKLFGQVHLDEYMPALKGKVLLVWLNMPRRLREEKERLVPEFLQAMEEINGERKAARLARAEKRMETEAQPATNEPPAPDPEYDASIAELDARAEVALRDLNRAVMVWYANIWSQGDDPETHWLLEELEELDRTDPDFLQFMLARSDGLLTEHRKNAKKA